MKPEIIDAFGDYMNRLHMDASPGTLDDDLADSYDAWLSNLDARDIEHYSQQFIRTNCNVYWKELSVELSADFIKEQGLNI